MFFSLFRYELGSERKTIKIFYKNWGGSPKLSKNGVFGFQTKPFLNWIEDLHDVRNKMLCPRNAFIRISIFGGEISIRHFRAGGNPDEFGLGSSLRANVAIVKTTDNLIFVIPGSTRNPALFQIVPTLDAGSGLPST
jgi:hypothetical protein